MLNITSRNASVQARQQQTTTKKKVPWSFDGAKTRMAMRDVNGF